MRIFLDLPPYLRQWLTDRCGGREPLVFPRGSIELTMLRTMLRAPRPADRPMLSCPPGWTTVEVPAFRGVPADSRNFLPTPARMAIEATIRERFDLDMWELVKENEYSLIPLDNLIDAWMEARGIEPDDTNTQAVRKRFQRLRQRATGNLRQRNHRKCLKNQ